MARPTRLIRAFPRPEAGGIGYDNSTSGLEGDTIQEAIDELAEGGNLDRVNVDASALSPNATITSTKSASNPTFPADSIPENIIRIGDTYYCVGMDWTAAEHSVLLWTATDRDGPWTAYAGNPIYTFDDVSWAPAGANDIYAPEIVEDGGTFYLFYGVYDNTDGSDGYIGVALASAITGPYADNGSAILSPGTAGAWDSLRVGEPSVIHHDGRWVMAYMAEDTDFAFGLSERIGVATASSPTGTWTKAAGNPLIDHGTTGEWDDDLIADPFIFFENGYYWIWYAGGGSVGGTGTRKWHSGLAYALDPTGTWTKHAGNPILSAGSSGFDEMAAWRGSVFIEDGLLSGVYGGLDSDLSDARGGNFRLTVDVAGSEGGILGLDDLGDVTIAAPVEGEMLRWNGSQWINDSGLICVDPGTLVIDDGDPFGLTLTSVWGIDGTTPYYDDANVDAGDEAALFYDPLTDNYTLIAYDF